jgi:hypothetical protein
MLIADWDTFSSSFSGKINQKFIAFLHRGNKIYVRSISDPILTMLKEKYNLVRCRRPDTSSDPKGWEYSGNSVLFAL